ncbi:hypothetical protein ACFLW4_01775 [Chloroflexota bacterium]
MNFLKGLAISILTLLLFLSLAVFGTVFMLKNTILDPDFVVTQVDRLDVAALAQEAIAPQVSWQVPAETAFLEEAIYSTITDNEPWIKEQVSAAIYSGYDYFLGKSERLSLMVSLEPLKQNLRENLWQVFQQNLDKLPPEFAAAPPAMVEQYFDEFYRQFSEQIPSEFEVDESSIPPEIMAQILMARQYISYVQTAYYALIALMVLLVMGIILLKRDVKSATRGLGITFLIYGILEYASVFATRYFLPTGLPLPEIPSSLQPWLAALIGDFVAPVEAFSIGLMAGGAALIIVSFVYPRLRKAAEVEE